MNCTRCATPSEVGDLRCAVCALVLAARAPVPDKTRARVLRCKDCGAVVAFSAKVQAPHCAFCGATMRVEQPIDPLERADSLLPFTVTRADAEYTLRFWLGRRGWLAPRDLAAGSTIASLQPLYWASWVVDARALVSWAADSNSDARFASWAPHSGQTSMDFDNIVVPASRGLTWMECMQLVPGYQLGSAQPIGSESGAVEEFDAQRSAARRTVLSAIEETAAARLKRGVIPGHTFRNVHVGALLQGLRTRRVALPAWVLAYHYRGQLYRAVVHGQKLGVVLGTPPISTAKVVGLIAAVVIPALLATLAWLLNR